MAYELDPILLQRSLAVFQAPLQRAGAIDRALNGLRAALVLAFVVWQQVGWAGRAVLLLTLPTAR